MTEKLETIGRRIARYRKMMGFSNTKELAEQIANPRISHAVISNIESGRRNDPSVSEVIEIARGLGISPIFLLVSALDPVAKVDLPNVSNEMTQTSSDEFLKWFLLDSSRLMRRETNQVELYQTFRNIQQLVTTQRICQESREKVHALSNQIGSPRVLQEQAKERYQGDLQQWYFLKMGLSNGRLADLSWLDESLTEDIDLSFKPSQHYWDSQASNHSPRAF
jgi:transcriptional regulator with XRE-family HTH domain